MKITLLLLVQLLNSTQGSRIKRNDAQSKFVYLQDLVLVFDKCRFVFHHYNTKISRMAGAGFPSTESRDLERLKHNFGNVQLQFKVEHVADKLVHYNTSKRSTKFGRHLATCYVDAFYHFALEDATKQCRHFESAFILLVSFSNGSYIRQENGFNYLVTFYRQAILLFVVDYAQVFLVCIPCDSTTTTMNLVPLQVGAKLDAIVVTQQWMEIHGNMHQVSVNVHSTNVRPCRLYPAKELDSSTYCTLFAITEKLNLTLSQDKGHSFLYPKVLLSYSEIPEIFVTRRAQFSPHGLQMLKFAFIVIYDRDGLHSLHGILRPFSSLVWAMLGLITFSITSLVVLDIKTRQRPLIFSWGKRIAMWVSISWLLLDQSCVTAGMLVKRQSRNILILWVLWATFCLVVNNWYKNCLFQLLATESPPTPMSNVEDLVDEKIQVVSIQDAISVDDGKLHSMLAYSVIPRVIQALSDPRLVKRYRSLAKSFVWLSSGNYQVAYNAIKYSIGVTRHNSVTNLSRPFAFFDLVKDAIILRQYFLVEKSNWVSKPVADPRSALASLWLLSSNYLYKIISKSLSQFYESGISQRWGTFDRFSSVEGELRRLKKSIESVEQSGKRVEVTYNPNRGITKGVYKNILNHFIICVFVCNIVLLLEFYFGRISVQLLCELEWHPNQT